MTRHLELKDVRICLEDDGDGFPLLLLHGFPATRALWSRVAPHLVNAGFRTLVPDLVGYGDSEAPSSARIDMASQARWLLELLDALDLAHVILIAHDVGSAAAQLLLVDAPERIRGFVVLDGVCGSEWAMDAITSIRDWEPAEAHRLSPVLIRRLGKSAALREMLSAYQGVAGGLRLIRAARDLDPQQTAKLSGRLRTIAVPSLVLWGDRDEFLPIESVGRALAELLNAELISLPGGHFTPLDCPEEVSAALHVFLARLRNA